jgi:hypothetical protein
MYISGGPTPPPLSFALPFIVLQILSVLVSKIEIEKKDIQYERWERKKMH